MFGDEDIAAVFMTDFAEPATWNGETVQGLFRVETIERSDNNGQIVSMEATVFRVATADLGSCGPWTGFANEQDIVVRGRTYRVRDMQKVSDGQLTLLILAS
jgi:hypothetical protein